jgi:hypothetical protein
MQLQRITPQTTKEAAEAIYNNNMDSVEREFAVLWKAVKEGREPRKRR